MDKNNRVDHHWFRLFLCSRWGCSGLVIDQMPLSEFIDHKVFWEKHKWGMSDDILSSILAQVVAGRTHSKPQTNLAAWKESIFNSVYVVKRIGAQIKSINNRIRSGVMSMYSMISGNKK